MPESAYDCIVIGSGPGGYVAADFGITVPERSIDFGAVSERRKKVIKTLTGGVGGLMKKNKIDVIEGVAALTADGNVKVGEDEIQAKTVIIATGSVPKPVPGTEFGGRVIGTEEAWAFEELPATLAVIGAGASGAEIASAYGRMGVKVLLFEALDRVLPTEDADISNAAGRGPDIEALNLEEAGVKLDDRGLIDVDAHQRTSKEGVYAIGDIVHGPALAHKSSDEGIIAVEDAAGMEVHGLEYADIPRATFCAPNVASFGLTEEQAREAGMGVVVGKLQYGAVGAGTVYGDRSGVIKIIGDKKYGELVGGHIVGAKAVVLIQELVNAKALEGGYAEVARIVHGHPTFSEGVMEAARASASRCCACIRPTPRWSCAGSRSPSRAGGTGGRCCARSRRRRSTSTGHTGSGSTSSPSTSARARCTAARGSSRRACSATRCASRTAASSRSS